MRPQIHTIIRKRYYPRHRTKVSKMEWSGLQSDVFGLLNVIDGTLWLLIDGTFRFDHY